MIETMLREVDWSLVELRPLKKKAQAEFDHAYRMDAFAHCPLSVWAKDAPKDKRHWATYAEFRGMTQTEHIRVTHTADAFTESYGYYDPILRKRMRDRISKAKARKKRLSQNPMDLFFSLVDWAKVDISQPNSPTCPLRVFAGRQGAETWCAEAQAKLVSYGVDRPAAENFTSKIWKAADKVGYYASALRRRMLNAIARAKHHG